MLDDLKPDLICIDNVILFPATKRYGAPWVRIISCSENEVPDPDIPPHLSGCGENDKAGFEEYRSRFNEVIKPIHDDFNAFLGECGEPTYPIGEFFETSPYMNLLLYPEPVKYKRRNTLDPQRFQYLEGCVRREEAYDVPRFDDNADSPLLYLSFGSLGSGDTNLLKRLMTTLGKLPYRVLVNIGDYGDAYAEFPTPPNIHTAGWYPQPSVIAQCDAAIHHGGNNSFTECLYFGKPALIMPYVWDGHDNATRVQEMGHGLKLHRANWTDDELAAALSTLTQDAVIQAKLKATSAHMRSQDGTKKAANLLDDILKNEG